MEKPKRPFDVSDVASATHFNRRSLGEWIARAERAFADTDRAKRLERHECRWCFYARSGGVAGAALTSKPCDACGDIQHYESTATDRLCRACAERLGLCVRCIADVDLVDRRKLERKR